MLRTFIDRPIFASVISIIITLGGALALLGLPVEQYPTWCRLRWWWTAASREPVPM